VGVGVNQEERFFLLNAGEIEEVGIGAQQRDTIGIGRQNVIAVHDGERVRKQQLLEIVSVGGEQFVINRSVSHVVSFNFGAVNARMSILEQDGDKAIDDW
jgi:hypothetical protein